MKTDPDASCQWLNHGGMTMSRCGLLHGSSSPSSSSVSVRASYPHGLGDGSNLGPRVLAMNRYKEGAKLEEAFDPR